MRRACVLVLAAGLAVGGCGGSDDSQPPASPGANVDPTSDNVITDPINRAKRTAEQQEERDQQIDGFDQ